MGNPWFGTRRRDRPPSPSPSSEESRDLLGLFAIDGAVVVRNALDRVTLDSGPPPAHIRSGLTSYRLHRNALEIMDMIATMPYDPDDV
jgi:hypothetical protein